MLEERGRIKRLMTDRGFGFIRGDRGDEIFFHASDAPEFSTFQEGQRVRYVVTTSAKGPRAVGVQLV